MWDTKKNHYDVTYKLSIFIQLGIKGKYVLLDFLDTINKCGYECVSI